MKMSGAEAERLGDSAACHSRHACDRCSAARSTPDISQYRAHWHEGPLTLRLNAEPVWRLKTKQHRVATGSAVARDQGLDGRRDLREGAIAIVIGRRRLRDLPNTRNFRVPSRCLRAVGAIMIWYDRTVFSRGLGERRRSISIGATPMTNTSLFYESGRYIIRPDLLLCGWLRPGEPWRVSC